MLTWLQNNAGTIVVSVIVLGLLVLVAWGMIRDKKQGKSPCAGCSQCALQGKCGKTK